MAKEKSSEPVSVAWKRPTWAFPVLGVALAIVVIALLVWWFGGKKTEADKPAPTSTMEQKAEVESTPTSPDQELRDLKARLEQAKKDEAISGEIAAVKAELAKFMVVIDPESVVSQPTQEQQAPVEQPALSEPAVPAPTKSGPVTPGTALAVSESKPVPLSPREEREYGVGDKLAVNPGNPSAILPETGMYFGNAADNIAQEKLERARFQERRETLRIKMEYEKAKEQAKLLQEERAKVEREAEAAKKSGFLPGDPLSIGRLDEETREKLASIDQQLAEITATMRGVVSASVASSPATAPSNP